MNHLKIGADSRGKTFSLPLEVVTEKLAFLGRTGSGKTYGATKLAELMLEAGAQIVALDPVGVWRGLRMGGDFGIYIFGGLSGDFPLESTAGALVADLIVDRGVSAVLDVSQFESDAEKARFAAAFADRFFFRKKAAPSPVHIFIEECQEFVPQNIQRGEERMLHAFQRMWKLGRNFGIGGSLISQRPQDVNKKALNQAGTLFVFQLTGPQERKAVEGWISDNGVTAADLHTLLPQIKVGQPHVWSPTFLEVSETVQIAFKETADVSSTPKVGQASAAKPLTPIDAELLRTAMAATVERAKENDPTELRKELANFKKANSRLLGEIQAINGVVDGALGVGATGQHFPTAITGVTELARRFKNAAPASVPMLSAEEFENLNILIGQGAQMSVELQGWRDRCTAVMAALNNRQHQAGLSLGPVVVNKAKAAPLLVTSARDQKLSKADIKVLTVLAQHPDGCQKGKLCLLAGYTYSGGFRNTLSALRTWGYISGGNEETMRITDAGRTALGAYTPLPTGAALQEYWLNHPMFATAEREVLRVLLEAPITDGYDGPALAAKCGREYSGGFRNTLAALRTAGVIVGKNTGSITANPELY